MRPRLTPNRPNNLHHKSRYLGLQIPPSLTRVSRTKSLIDRRSKRPWDKVDDKLRVFVRKAKWMWIGAMYGMHEMGWSGADQIGLD